MIQLATYAWPGNFRELVGTLCTLAALHDPDETITLAALPQSIGASSEAIAPAGDLGTLTEAEMRYAVNLHRETSPLLLEL